MLLVSLLFGSTIGFFAALISYFGFDASFGSAFMLYLTCAILPAMMSVAAAATQLLTSPNAKPQVATTR